MQKKGIPISECIVSHSHSHCTFSWITLSKGERRNEGNPMWEGEVSLPARSYIEISKGRLFLPKNSS